jgi:NACalpha-BTF3-like transcription factor
MIPHAEKLIEKAQKGEKLTTAERRHCVAFLMATERPTNSNMGNLFKVSERQIRLDKEHIRKERAKEITEEDISLVISDIAMVFETQIRDIERSKKKCKMGGRAYLEHCKTIFKSQLEKVKALQDLGYYPKNLGQMTVEKYEYKAIVSKDGSVETRPTELTFEDVEVVEQQPAEQKALPAPEYLDRDVSEFET